MWRTHAIAPALFLALTTVFENVAVKDVSSVLAITPRAFCILFIASNLLNTARNLFNI